MRRLVEMSRHHRRAKLRAGIIAAIVPLVVAACASTAAAQGSAGSASAHASRPAFYGDTLLQRAWLYSEEQLLRSASALDPRAGYPRHTRADGSWTLTPYTEWTSGFFAGSLWYVYELTHDPKWRHFAERWTEGLAPAAAMTNTHDLGFIVFDSFGHGYRLTGDSHYRAVLFQACRSLATRYNPRVGAIKSWDLEGATDRRRDWHYPVIVDNLMNLEMLFWAAQHGGDPQWGSIAVSHALVSSRAHVRPDGSTAHVALFDPVSGALERTVTWQGYSDSSTWARGQAWAIHGLASAYDYTRNPELLRTAQRVADWYLAHIPPDGVPYWDFDDPAIPNAPRDASAAAIAAAGLLDLADQSDAAAASRYREAAHRTLDTLAARYLTRGTGSAAILQHATGGLPQHSEIDVGLVYADYFFVEALVREAGADPR